MVKLVLCYGLGIGLDIHGYSVPIGILLLSVFLYGFILLRDKALLTYRWELGISLCIGIVFVCLGNIRASYIEAIRAPVNQHAIEEWNCKQSVVGGIVEKAPKATASYPKAIIKLLGVQLDSSISTVQAKILVDLSSVHSLEPILRGDTLFAKGYLTNFQSPYPTYRHFIHQQGIRYRFYVDTLLVKPGPIRLRSWGVRTQQLLANRLKQVIDSEREQEIALAMFLGYKQSLSQETRMPFTISGASHILSISGMHIGIIFVLLNFFLGFFHGLPHGARIKNVCILFLLLVYMVLTGLSPAVVRATLMFGLIILFRVFTVRFQLLNVVASASMIQLLCDPDILQHVGFQLSYAAVVGILILFPYVEKICKTPWKWVNVVYGWIGISLCAGLATAPLVLVHFGTFPVYFILTNILTTALAGAIIWVGFLTVLSLFIPFLSDVLGFLCEQLLSLLIYLTSWVSQLPHAQIYGDQIGSPSLGILIGQLAVVGLLFSLPKLITIAINKKTLQNTPPKNLISSSV